MAAIASQPFPPTKNPPRVVSMDAGLAGHTVRLEVPDELRGEWEGLVYATLGRSPKLLKEDDRSPFVTEEDGMRRPAWQATLTVLICGQRREALQSAVQDVDVPYWILHWRLTQPDRNLKDELLERPLLSVFRFVRSRVYNVASPVCDTKFFRYTSSVPILGQSLQDCAR
ncbi:hypothetical protein PHMEG_00032204 [Phytophthora megakarya]|uniref:Uncharacterized protein n=1 Tax=Phytophthora megakarya TaxID=4795 RepID=A0A225UW37_9STRA|nr:hypothetical protein PHMEG_00032204 [Phytophthora megakarya]